VNRPAETMQQRIAQVRELSQSANIDGHSSSMNQQTVQVDRRAVTPEQPSAGARQTTGKTTPEPVMSLYDLFGFTQEERSQVRKRKTRRKKEDSGQLSLFDMPPLEQHSAMQTTPAEPTPPRKRTAGAGTTETGTSPARGKSRPTGTHEAPSIRPVCWSITVTAPLCMTTVR